MDSLNEFRRVVAPGGYLIISTHGRRYLDRLSAAERDRFDSGHLVVKGNVTSPGSNACSAYHPEQYVRDHLARGFDVVDFRPEGATGNPRQDLYLLRKSVGSSPRHTEA